MSAEARLTELGLQLPTPEPRGSYVPGKLAGGLLFLAGHGPIHPDGVAAVRDVRRDRSSPQRGAVTELGHRPS